MATRARSSPRCDDLDEVAFICMTDAARAIRRDGSSQGGCFIVASNKSALHGKTVKCAVVDWRPWMLPV
eukprot:4123053-Pyramimonas_sp.AAC.1